MPRRTSPIFIPRVKSLDDYQELVARVLNGLAAQVNRSGFLGDVDAGNNRLTNLPRPTGARDATNRQYVDEQINGLASRLDRRTETADTIPTAAILPYAAASAPAGYLLCDGTAVSRTSYARLFAKISTTYGTGDGSTTFNLPDLRGRFPLGADNMGGSSANRVTATEADNLGQGSGAETHAIAEAELPSHTHTLGSHTHSYTEPTTSVVQSGTGATGGGTTAGTTGGGSGPTGATGSGTAMNLMNPWLTINYIIKT